MNYLDVKKYDFKKYDSEKETAYFFDSLGLKCLSLNHIRYNMYKEKLAELDGLFLDEKNKFYIMYDDSDLDKDRAPKIRTFITKWKEPDYDKYLRDELKLKNYPIYYFYIDKSGKEMPDSVQNIFTDGNSFYMTKNDYTYFKKEYLKVNKWVLNDIYNYLGIKSNKPILEAKDAIQIYIGNDPAFIFADSVDNILDYCFVNRRRNQSDKGYQRVLDPKRIKNITNSIKNNKITSFPNSILLNCVEDIDFKLLEKHECPGLVKLNIPSIFSSCKVVDGQHRLLSFCNLDEIHQGNAILSIVMFYKMSLVDEIKTFIDVNDNQKSIDSNLIYDLKSELDYNNDTIGFAQKNAVKIAYSLNEKGVLKESIYFDNIDNQTNKNLTLTTIVQSLVSNKFISYKSKGIFQNDLSDITTPITVINDIFSTVITSGKIKFFKTNIGFKLLIKFTTLLKLNIDMKKIDVDFLRGINDFCDSIKIIENEKNYGGGGFNVAFKKVIDEMKKKPNYKGLEILLKNLK